MKTYTTEQVIKMGEGTMVIGLGTGWHACYGIEFKRLAPNHEDMQCRRLDGKHAGSRVTVFREHEIDLERRWIPYNELFKVDEANRLNKWIGKKIRLKKKVRGEIVQGVLGSANTHHVVLKVYTDYVPSPAWVKSKDGEARKPYYIRPLGEDCVDPDLWELVPEE